MELDDTFSRKNPFTVPEIVVQPNSPVPGLPDPSHLAQAVPLGPAAYGTGLYQPSLSSMTKYQYKTPALSSSQPPPSTQYRTLSGVLSNNLKKNWVTPAAAPASQSQRKIDQAEIDARLKSLMDRLSSQQSLLKPAEKPSAQMQHYLQSTSSSQTRKLSDSALGQTRTLSGSNISPVRKLSEASSSSSVTKPADKEQPEAEDSPFDAVVEEVKDNETEDSESDSSEDSESVTTELDEVETNNVELQVPEIKINLAEAEDLSPQERPVDVKCDTKCDKQDISESEGGRGGEGEKRKAPVRRASLLKTVVSIKSDTPVTVVNYTHTDQDSKENTPVKTDITATDLEDSFQTPKLGDDSKENGESFTTAMDTSSSFAEDSMVTEKEINGSESRAVECSNENVVTSNGLVSAAQHEEEAEEECGNLVIVTHNAEPQQNGENETSTDLVEKEEEKQENDLVDIYKITDSREKKEKIGEYNQQHSNMIHDLIIGKTKQRRSRQPRVTAPISSVPPPPQDPSPKSEQKGLETFGDFQMIDDEDGVKSREKSLSRSVRSNSISRSLRESSTSRSMREGSPKITLPPTPLTNPEKYGISRREQEKSKAHSKGSILSLISPTESVTSNDMDYHLDGLNSDSSAPVSPTKSASSTQSPAHQQGKKSKGFMAAVAGIFRSSSPASSSSPVTSPSHESKMARAARKEGKSREDDLLLRTASLSLKASHPSTPPVPLSRRVKLGSGPPQASEDSFSDEEDESKDRSLSAFVKESSKTGLPKQIFERLEKRMSKSGKKAAKQATSLRVRRAQEIQRELEEVEVEIGAVEERGVGLEQELRRQETECGGDMMQQWFKLLGDKNKLVRREQELMVEAKQLELEDQSEKLESELAGGELVGHSLQLFDLMTISEPGNAREGEILGSLVKMSEQREMLISMLARDRERYRLEDRELQIKMAEQGIRYGLFVIVAQRFRWNNFRLN